MRARLLHALRDPSIDGRGLRRIQGAGVLLSRVVGPGVRGLLFDAGNTLVFIDPERMVEIYRAEGFTVDSTRFQSVELQARRVLHDRIEEGSKGTEPELWHEYFVALFAGCGIPTSGQARVSERVRAAHAESHLWTFARPSTADVMTELAEAGYRIGVISNADGRMEGALERAGIRPYVEFVIDSATVGVEKPAPEIFYAGCEELDMTPDECLYIGDLYPVDYVGATEAGLEAVLLDPLGVHSERASTVSDLEALPEWLEGRHA